MFERIPKRFLSIVTLMMLILTTVTMPVFASTSDTVIIHRTKEEIKALLEMQN